MTEITLTDVKRLCLEPGDTLVLYVPPHLSSEQLEKLRETMRSAFPDHKTAVILDTMRLEVVEP